jgi:hypothetical protein
MGMPGKDLTVAQRLTLLVLMSKASPLSRSFLVETVKISLTQQKRDELRDEKLITVSGKPMILELTEKGWAQAIKEMDAELPPPPGALGGALYVLLGVIRDHLERNDLSAADFFASSGPLAKSSAADPDVQSAIRKAYGELAARPGDYVMLEDLRGSLGLPTDAVDAALLRLDREPDIHLVPESNQKVLTPGQRAAALRLGNQHMHLLAIRV